MRFPTRFMLIAAMNPCPCGYLGCATRDCRCTSEQIRRYQDKLSGPLLDRIDLHVEVPAMDARELLHAPSAEASAPMRTRCAQARLRATNRQGCANQALDASAIAQHAAPDEAASQFLQAACTRLGWSARGAHRCLKIARTIADLADSAQITQLHIAEAMQYRSVLRARTAS